MQIFIKAALSLAVILCATAIGRKLPSLGGLIAVMPLTGVLVLVWLYSENKSDPSIMQEYSKGALYGIFPSVLFFLAAYICFKKQLPLPVVLCFSFGTWLVGAFVHQWLLR